MFDATILTVYFMFNLEKLSELNFFPNYESYTAKTIDAMEKISFLTNGLHF